MASFVCGNGVCATVAAAAYAFFTFGVSAVSPFFVFLHKSSIIWERGQVLFSGSLTTAGGYDLVLLVS